MSKKVVEKKPEKPANATMKIASQASATRIKVAQQQADTPKEKQYDDSVD